jgi:adenosylcobinamide-GDP ribazoletransferase
VAVRLPPRPGVTTASRVNLGGTVRAAVALLTRLPVRPDDDMASGAAAFPVVGVIVGLVGLLPLVLGGAAEPLLSSLLAVAAMTVLTGALHLDGLADTADALVAPDPATAERARKDPAVGPGGAVALMLVLATEVAALASLVTAAGALTAGAALVVAAAVGRTAPVVAVVLAGSRANGSGFGGWFAARVGRVDAVVAVVVALVVTAGLALAVHSIGIAVSGIAGAGAGLAIAAVIVVGRRTLDGDGMGAIIELTVAASLVAAAFAT